MYKKGNKSRFLLLIVHGILSQSTENVTITSTDLDIVSKDPGQSWIVSMSESPTQPLETTEIIFKHKHTSKHKHEDPKQRQWPPFVRLALEPRLPEFEFCCLPLLIVQPWTTGLNSVTLFPTLENIRTQLIGLF